MQPAPSRSPSAPRLVEVLLLTGAALAARALAALLVEFPPYTDPAYYAMVASSLADGHGFSAPVLYSFLEVGGRLPADPGLPVPSNGHWMPLTSIVAAPFVALLGDLLGEWRAAQLPMVVLSTALVPFTYLVGWELWGTRRVALGAGLLALASGPLLIMYPLVDNFAVFGAAGAGAIWCAIRGVRGARPGPWLVVAGALVGLATLARVDGLLLAVAPLTAWWLRRSDVPLARHLGWGVASAVAGVLVMAPWLARNLAVFGAAFPSAGGHTLLITEYNQQFSIGFQPDLGTFLAAGVPELVGARLVTWVELAGRCAVLLGGLFVLPFAWGLWHERGRRDLAPFIAYFVAMFVVMGAVFTLHAPKGAFYHSAPAWLPFGMPLAVASLPGAATAAARGWAFLGRPATHRFLLVVGLAAAMVLALVGSASLLVGWRDAHDKLRLAADFLAATAAPGDVVMSYDPPALWMEIGQPGVAPPFDRVDIITEVAWVYDVRWVVVTLRPGETRDPLDLWGGALSGELDGRPGIGPVFEAPGVRVYRVERRFDGP